VFTPSLPPVRDQAKKAEQTTKNGAHNAIGLAPFVGKIVRDAHSGTAER